MGPDQNQWQQMRSIIQSIFFCSSFGSSWLSSSPPEERLCLVSHEFRAESPFIWDYTQTSPSPPYRHGDHSGETDLYRRRSADTHSHIHYSSAHSLPRTHQVDSHPDLQAQQRPKVKGHPGRRPLNGRSKSRWKISNLRSEVVMNV